LGQPTAFPVNVTAVPDADVDGGTAESVADAHGVDVNV
jgi:hypothetical protein